MLDGRLTFTRPSVEWETVASGGWITPGFIDAHCHIGLAPHGHVPDPVDQADQALLDRAAGALLLRDAGSPVDNRSIQERDDLPRLIRAGRHIARPKRYVRELGVEVRVVLPPLDRRSATSATSGSRSNRRTWSPRSSGRRRPATAG